MKRMIGIAIAIMLVFMLAVPAMADSEATAGAGAEASVDQSIGDNSNNVVNNDADNKRSLPGAMGGPVPNMLAPFHDGRPTANLQDIRGLLSVRKTYKIKQLAVLESAADMDLTVRAYQSFKDSLGHPDKGISGLDPEGEITIVLAFPNRDTGEITMPDFDYDIAHITAKADDTDCDTVALMAASAIEAYRHGATKLVITGQGAKKLLEASGWAIMLGTMSSGINDNTGTALGGAVAAGIGYGEVETGYGYMPWFQAFAIK